MKTKLKINKFNKHLRSSYSQNQQPDKAADPKHRNQSVFTRQRDYKISVSTLNYSQASLREEQPTTEKYTNDKNDNNRSTNSKL